ncbi:PucR family transcriptional regulator [Arthrobacter citreus]|uniref:PucR family transcriptional regulator n=1 Tax=Arthrobacter TaxID=1663 RepID=UPI00126512A9|nr:PucR family transcriptional regulator [Arthrobacter gandavensis]
MLPTVRSVLELPVLREAEPRLLGSADGLDNAVRWVHVSEVLDVSGLLSGGELVLTTGLELEKDPGRTAMFVRSLQDAGAAGLVVEVIGDRRNALDALELAAASTAMPVVVVRRRVRFVQITEIVHRLIVAEQLERVERARAVHEAFTVLSLESAGTGQVVEQAAEMIGAPVVLEDLSHLVLAYAAHQVDTTVLLDNWERRSRTTPSTAQTSRSGSGDWLQTPVGVQRQVWGRLVVPVVLNDDAGAAMVLERAAQTLAINRLAERDRRDLNQQAQAGLLNDLRQPRGLGEGEAQARAAALGLRRSPFYLPVVFRGTSPSAVPDASAAGGGDPLAGQQEERLLLEQLARALKPLPCTAISAVIRSGSVGMLLALPSGPAGDKVLGALAAAVAPDSEREPVPGGVAGSWTIGVGRLQDSLLEAAAGIDEAAHVAETAATLSGQDRPFYRATDIRLRGLLALLRKDPRVQQFVESELQGVLDAEARGESGYLELLGQFLESGGNKSALARTSYLSRPTLYARLSRLEELLAVDLDDAESRTSLHVALLVHRLRAL